MVLTCSVPINVNLSGCRQPLTKIKETFVWLFPWWNMNCFVLGHSTLQETGQWPLWCKPDLFVLCQKDCFNPKRSFLPKYVYIWGNFSEQIRACIDGLYPVPAVWLHKIMGDHASIEIWLSFMSFTLSRNKLHSYNLTHQWLFNWNGWYILYCLRFKL